MPQLTFDVTDPTTGNSGFTTDDAVVQEMKARNYPIHGISADGMTITMGDEKGQPQQIDTADAIRALHPNANITGVRPANPVTEHVNPAWRAGVAGLENYPDDVKKVYLEKSMRQANPNLPKDLQIIGSGTDWHAFNPATNQWIALTNRPGMHLEDIAGAATHIPEFAGSMLGMVGGGGFGAGVGSAAGPVGTIGGAMAGGAAGGAAGGEIGLQARDYLMGQIDPIYKQVAEEQAYPTEAREHAALINAVSGGLGGSIGPAAKLAQGAEGVLPAMIRGAGMARQAGPASTALRGAGATAQAAGELAAPIGKAVAESPVAQGVISGVVPYAGPVTGAGALAEAPEMLTTGAARAPGWLADTAVGKMLPDTVRQRMRDISSSLLTKRTQAPLAERVAETMGGLPTGATTSADVLGNLAEQGVGRAKYFADPASQAIEENTIGAAKDLAQSLGMEGPEAEQFARATSEEALGPLRRQGIQQMGAGAGKIGETVGGILGKAATVGRAVQRAGEFPIMLGARGAQGLGLGLKYGGMAAKTAGTLGQPLEAQAFGRYYLLPKAEEEIQRLRGRSAPDIMDKALARPGL